MYNNIMLLKWEEVRNSTLKEVMMKLILTGLFALIIIAMSGCESADCSDPNCSHDKQIDKDFETQDIR